MYLPDVFAVSVRQEDGSSDWTNWLPIRCHKSLHDSKEMYFSQAKIFADETIDFKLENL